MQSNGGGVAILAEDHYEDPELWRILWRALLASDDHQDSESAGPAPRRQIPRMSTATLGLIVTEREERQCWGTRFNRPIGRSRNTCRSSSARTGSRRGSLSKSR
jgi:hypothetical protein